MPFFLEDEQGEVVTINGYRYRAMLNELLFTKTTALRATQPKLHSMFCTLLLKIALSAAELIRLATSELRFDTVGLLFVGCRQR